MVLVVLRHGQSEWNKDNRFTGLTDVMLSEYGIEQARNCSDILANYDFNYFFTSELSRTIITLSYIQMQRNYGNYLTVHSNELNERDYGSLTGKNKDELKHEYGDDQVYRWRRGYRDAPPNGESLEDVVGRVGRYYDESIKPLIEQNNNILIVSHGNTLRALFVHLGIKTPETIEHFEISTGVPLFVNLENNTFRTENQYVLDGYQILDSRGHPTLEVKCYDKERVRCIGRGSCPSGASCGSNEMLELRDDEPNVYKGKSVYNAISNVVSMNDILELNDHTMTDLRKLDEQLMRADISTRKCNIGGNAITAMSFCLADVISQKRGMEMYEYFAEAYGTSVNKNKLPTPMVNIINGGKHSATGHLKIQEFMIFINEEYHTTTQVEMTYNVYQTLRGMLLKKYGLGATAIGDEGGFCPPVYSTREALDLINDAIVLAGYIVGTDVYIALDCAASEFYNTESSLYEIENEVYLNRDELIKYYCDLITKYPAIKSIEDAFHESDYIAWTIFSKHYSDKIMIVGDDLFTSNPKIIKQGLDAGWANTLLLKVNQIGTITEAIDGAKMMFERGRDVIVSHRSGETNHAYLIDIAVGIGAKYVKIGSPCRGERVAKFNRLLEISQM